MESAIYSELIHRVPEENILVDEPMTAHTSFKIGGTADFFVTARTIGQIKAILELVRWKNMKLTVIGNGTNLLVKDGGIRGITLKLDFKNFVKEKKEDIIIYTVGASNPVAAIAAKALEDSATGLEFACGIPGTIGGAIRMNAGAYGGEFKDIVLQTTYMDYDGDIYTINNEEHEFEYRDSIFKKINAILLESKLRLKKGNKEEIKNVMQENMEARKQKQPIDIPSAGSTFKRGNGFVTAKLIDEAGLKGMQIGGAQVSPKHAGFIVNTGGATAQDVLTLMQTIKTTVKEKFNVDIEEEIQIVGED